MKAVELKQFLTNRSFVDENGVLYSYGPITYKIEINRQKVEYYRKNNIQQQYAVVLT